MLRAEDVSRYFLAIQEAETSEPISNLKIQKLCYYAQGFALATLGKPLFFEDIEHWKHGPVVQSLWMNYHSYGSGPIPLPQEPLNLSLYDSETKSLLDKIYQLYGQSSAWELRNKTHSEPPWINTPDGCPITHQALRVYFESMIELIQPSSDCSEESFDQVSVRMARDLPFRELTERGLSDIAAGRYSKLHDVQRRLNDV